MNISQVDPQIIRCAAKLCTRYVEYGELNCVTQDFSKCDICSAEAKCPCVVLTEINCVVWKCVAHVDLYMISTATLSSKLVKCQAEKLYLFIFLFSVAVNLLLVLLFFIVVVYMKNKQSGYDVEASGVLGDGHSEVDFNAEEVNADDNDDECPSSILANENYVRNFLIDNSTSE